MIEASKSVKPLATTTESHGSVRPSASVTLCFVKPVTSVEVITSIPHSLTLLRNWVSTSPAGVNDGNSTCQPRSLPPSSASFSMMTGLMPCSARRRAVCMPATPPPKMITRFFIIL